MAASRGLAIALLAAMLAAGGCQNLQAPSRGQEPDVTPSPVETAQPRASAEMLAYYDALAQVAELRYDQARPRLDELAGRFEQELDEAHAAEATFWAAWCCEKLDQQPDALERYHRVLARWPGTDAAAKAQQRIDLLTT
jgi:TolA-binding protein